LSEYKKIVMLHWEERKKRYKSHEKIEKKISTVLKKCGECKKTINIGEEYYSDIFWGKKWKNHSICESCWRGDKLSAKGYKTKFVKERNFVNKSLKKSNSLIL